jgi:drug/metabolite transporter (DMT)-like permease
MQPTSSATTRPPPALVWPLAAVALATALFIGMDTTAKSLSEHYNALQLCFLRFASGLLFAAPMWFASGAKWPDRSRWASHGLRSAMLLFTLLCWFHSLTLLPLVQAVAVGYMAPIFISLLAMWLLHERPSSGIWAALALGVLGLGVALWPEWRAQADAGSAARIQGLLVAALSAIGYSGVIILARHQAQRDSLWTILLMQNLLPTVALVLPMALAWPGGFTAWPQFAPLAVQADDVPRILLMGLLATGGLMAMTWAFSHIEASRAAPVEYTGLIWAAALGYLLFGELPTGWTLLSAGLIVVGCLLLVRGESKPG